MLTLRSPRPLLVLLLALLLPLSSFWLVGCDDSDDDDDDALPSERGRAVRDLAYGYRQQVDTMLNMLRLRLMEGQRDLESVELASNAAYDSLLQLHGTVQDFITFAAAVDLNGTIQRAAPLLYDTTLTATDVSSSDAFIIALETAEPAVGDVWETTQGAHLYYHARSVQPFGEPTEGVLLAQVELDTLTRRTMAYHSIDSHPDEGVFFLDANGRVIFDEADEFYGSYFNDGGLYEPAHVELAEQMLAEEDGWGEYTSTGAPGAGETGGQRVIGWVRVTVDNTFWVIAVAEPL